mgnify:CR=1 FL=1
MRIASVLYLLSNCAIRYTRVSRCFLTRDWYSALYYESLVADVRSGIPSAVSQHKIHSYEVHVRSLNIRSIYPITDLNTITLFAVLVNGFFTLFIKYYTSFHNIPNSKTPHSLFTNEEFLSVVIATLYRANESVFGHNFV